MQVLFTVSPLECRVKQIGADGHFSALDM